MTQKIHLYNHVEDAWEANLADWLKERSHASLKGHETWLVVGSYFQASWLRRCALSRKIPLFGIQFFDRMALREHLCRVCLVPYYALGREALEALLEIAAGEDPAFRARDSLLHALEELAGSDYLATRGLEAACELLNVPDRLRGTIAELISSPCWAPRTDAVLLERMQLQPGVEFGLFGLDYESAPDLTLVRAAAKAVERTYAWIAQPLAKEELEFAWISKLERALSADVDVCPMSDTPRPFEGFLGCWQGGGSRVGKLPETIVCSRWWDQVQAIVRHVATALVEGAQSVLVVVPDNSSTGNAVVNSLISRGITVADEFKENRPLPLSIRLQIAVARFLSGGRIPEDFLQVIRCLVKSEETFRAFRSAFIRSFESRQVRLAATLINLELRERFLWLRDLESALEPLPLEAGWNELRQRWETLLRQVAAIADQHRAQLAQVSFARKKTDWAQVDAILKDRLSTSECFLQYVIRSVSAQPREPHPESHHRYAKVCTATAAKAHGTSWDCVVLADSVANGWPATLMANPFLSDHEKIRLRQAGHWMLTTSERRQLQEERYLQLAFAARKRLVISRYEQDEKGEEVVGNNLSTFCEELLKVPVTRFRALLPPIDHELVTFFRKICADRIDPMRPFDEYFLNFSGMRLEMPAWHPSELEAAFKTPATFAFRLVFHSVREHDRRFVRCAPATVGRATHRLLERTFGGSGQFGALGQSENWSKEEVCNELLLRVHIAAEKLRSEFRVETADLWWNTVLNKAATFAVQMVRQISTRFDREAWYHPEYTWIGAIETASGRLALVGRTDLVVSDRENLHAARISICDFKTSKQLARFDEESGDGLQLLGYRLLAQANHAVPIEVLVVRPDGLKLIEFPSNEQLMPLLVRLARLQEYKSFGRRPAEKWEISEQLPIATLPVDPSVLERKLELTWN
jgi:hypothetical protein